MGTGYNELHLIRRITQIHGVIVVATSSQAPLLGRLMIGPTRRESLLHTEIGREMFA